MCSYLHDIIDNAVYTNISHSMITIYSFVFNPFFENTYLLHDQTRECVIIDAGCSTPKEEKMLVEYIERNELNPVRLLCTHCHIDHVLGARFVGDTYGLLPEFHRAEQVVMDSLPSVGQMYGIEVNLPERGNKYIETGEIIHFGVSELETLFTPGHSPGSISFYHAQERFCISGDVLFNGSIGRTDLPGGSYRLLIDSIESQLMTLPPETMIYSGHGETTSVGFEQKNNPFLQ